MSLHQKLTMSKSKPDSKKRTATSPDLFTGGPAILSVSGDQFGGTEKTVFASSVDGHICGVLSRVNAFLQFYFTIVKESQISGVFRP